MRGPRFEPVLFTKIIWVNFMYQLPLFKKKCLSKSVCIRNHEVSWTRARPDLSKANYSAMHSTGEAAGSAFQYVMLIIQLFYNIESYYVCTILTMYHTKMELVASRNSENSILL